MDIIKKFSIYLKVLQQEKVRHDNVRVEIYLIHYVKVEYNKNLDQIKNYTGNENLEIIIVMNKVKEKLATFKGLIHKLEVLFNVIKSKYVIVMSTKSLIGELKSEFKTEENGEYNFDDLIRLMEGVCSKINTVNISVETVSKTYKNIKYVEIQL
ncbi:hypothetical protein AK88_02730 [Plasmodium fragile]|uniref:Uncharacterized protein n=1 Tax=Plasmodium fragile TaxID=5857 RepID=A0A0D9QKM3_PLAFR|nr:uncharacterized protein AK88_02730 [Plasmodium fragile]KJP87564.1 hypothetical protein AK88_02730 [Plasmodium fragile]